MDIAMIGLGRMGANMARRLMRSGHGAVVYDLDPKRVGELAAEGATGAASVEELVAGLPSPRAIWLMLPAGAVTEGMLETLAPRLARGDIVVDGGNSHFKDDVRRAERLRDRFGIHYIDVGTSGGVWGLQRGYSLMIGGADEPVARLEPVFRALAPGEDGLPATPGRAASGDTARLGYLHCGPAGSGHFVKMVHNGIEYGVMQAYAEGFDILRHAGDETLPESQRYALDLAAIAEVWRHGSVIQSWLLDLTAAALADDPQLEQYSGVVEDSGEGRWTVETAIAEAVPAGVIAGALFARFRSRQSNTFGEKVLSAMRHKFGGHVERRSHE